MRLGNKILLITARRLVVDSACFLLLAIAAHRSRIALIKTTSTILLRALPIASLTTLPTLPNKPPSTRRIPVARRKVKLLRRWLYREKDLPERFRWNIKVQQATNGKLLQDN